MGGFFSSNLFWGSKKSPVSSECPPTFLLCWSALNHPSKSPNGALVVSTSL